MNISSSTTSISQQPIYNTNKAEGKVEGNKPDADSDKDGAVKAASTANATNPTQSVNNTSLALGAVGNNINLKA